MKPLLLFLFAVLPLAAQTRLVPLPATGVSFPVFLTHAPGQPDLLYIVEKGGGLEIFHRETETTTSVPLFSGLITAGERGFLGLAFHPDFTTNGYAYCYTSLSKSGAGIDHETLVRRITFTSPTSIAAGSDTPVLRFDQPYANHNGGWMGFGPDGYLYIASGDGGDEHDPGDRAQDTNTLFGKLLRIDVDGDDFPSDPDRNYAIPGSNPFATSGGAPEVWSYGLRNPWRCSFDGLKGDLYLADVGQTTREEISVQPANSIGGENYGWRLREGKIATPTGGVGGSRPPGAVDPVHDYNIEPRASITGGYVYRGPSPSLQGKYFFADYEADRLWSIEVDSANSPPSLVSNSLIEWTTLLNGTISGSFFAVSSFGEDSDGNIYVVGITGPIHLLVAEPAAPRISQVEVSGSTATLAIEDLTPDTIFHLQRTATPDDPSSWIDRQPFTTFAGSITLDDNLPVTPAALYYRVATVPAE